MTQVPCKTSKLRCSEWSMQAQQNIQKHTDISHLSFKSQNCPKVVWSFINLHPSPNWYSFQIWHRAVPWGLLVLPWGRRPGPPRQLSPPPSWSWHSPLTAGHPQDSGGRTPPQSDTWCRESRWKLTWKELVICILFTRCIFFFVWELIICIQVARIYLRNKLNRKQAKTTTQKIGEKNEEKKGEK